MNIPITGTWYHGTNLVINELKKDSTITPWRELAEAFSHKPAILCYDEGEILHTGEEQGYLYVIDEEIEIGKDIYQHPRTTMDKNAEFLTSRTIKLKLMGKVPRPDDNFIITSQNKINEFIKKKKS